MKSTAAEYCRSHALSPEQGKVMRAITNCRTARLGGHLDVCPACGYARPSYNSCRNRHCPKCQTLAKERWVDNQKHDLLNVAYFHVVFTVPSELNPCFSAATGRCTICCFGQSPKPCPNLLPIGSTWKHGSGLLLFCIPGARISASTPIFTASFRPAA